MSIPARAQAKRNWRQTERAIRRRREFTLVREWTTRKDGAGTNQTGKWKKDDWIKTARKTSKIISWRRVESRTRLSDD